MRGWWGLVVLLLLVGCRQTGAAPEELVEQDLSAALAWVRAVHPAPERHRSAEELDRAQEEAAAALGEALARGEEPRAALTRALFRALAPLGDGHLGVGLEPLIDEPGALWLPLFPIETEDGFRVRSSSDPALEGARLQGIDGRPMEAWVEQLTPWVLADGADLASEGRRHELAARFPLYLALALGSREQVELELDSGTVTLSGRPPREVMAFSPGRRSPEPSLAWVDEELLGAPKPAAWAQLDVGLLRLPAFGVVDMEGYAEAVRALWPELARGDALVIDLRGNEGGFRPNGMVVLAGLLEERSQLAGWTRWGSPHEELAPPRRGDGAAGLLPEQSGFMPGMREGDPLADYPIDPPGRVFSGPLAVLIDGGVKSAAQTFALTLERERPETLLVGRPTGGDCAHHVGELPMVYRLGPERAPRGHVLLSLYSVEHLVPAGCVPGTGLPPDVVAWPTLEGGDGQLRAALVGLAATTDAVMP